MADEEPVRIVLTEEQRSLVKRLSGQHVEAIELGAADETSSSGPLRFFWRLSAATGIPRRAWMVDDQAPIDDDTTPQSK
ncbi:MAG TPA: hypothetical protein VGM50_03955 [Gemmatimonadaceae bacterium]